MDTSLRQQNFKWLSSCEDTLSSRRESIKSHSWSVERTLPSSFQRGQQAKGEKCLRSREPEEHDLSQVIKVTPSVISCVEDSIPLWCDVTRRAVHLCGLPLQTHSPSLSMRKTSHKPWWKDMVQDTRSVLLETVKVTKDKQRRDCHSRELSKEL